jgi:TRAP-type uncharacterized transport system substrate-binding protein
MEIKILTTSMGSSGFIAGFALSEVLNKHVPNIQAAALESKSYGLNMETYLRASETRKNHVYGSDLVAWSLARDGRPPFTTAVGTGLRAIGVFLPAGGFSIVTYDPNLKRPKDLDGMKIATVAKGSILDVVPSMISDYYGISLKHERIGMAKSKDAIIDGLLKIASLPVGTKWQPEIWTVGTLIMEMLAKQQTYLIEMSKAEIEGMVAKSGITVSPEFLQKGALGYNCPPKDTWVVGCCNCWFVDENMDENLVYLIVKAIIDHPSGFERHYPQLKYIRNYIGSATLPKGEKYWHPGALKVFKEAGLKLGEWAR